MGLFDWIFRKKKDDLSLTWSDKYRIGVLEIDVQHENLFKLYNALVDAVYKGEGIKVLQKCLDDLFDYVIVHFTTGEAYMEKCHYPGIADHKAAHKVLREKTYYIHKDFTDGKPVLTMEGLLFVKDWIHNHVLGVDMQYKPYLTGGK